MHQKKYINLYYTAVSLYFNESEMYGCAMFLFIILKGFEFPYRSKILHKNEKMNKSSILTLLQLNLFYVGFVTYKKVYDTLIFSKIISYLVSKF